MQLVAAHLLARVPGTLEGHSNTFMIVYDTVRNKTDEGVLRQRNETAYT